MKARLKDVAARAGVAINTASMVLNKRDNSWVSKSTSARVFAAAEELDYRPDRAAVALQKGRTDSVGLVISTLQNATVAAMAERIETMLAQHGYDMVIENSRGETAREAQCLRNISHRRVDGMICFVSTTEESRTLLAEYFAESKPVIALTESLAHELPVDAVQMDFSHGMSEAARHLAALGHRRVALVLPETTDGREGSRAQLFRRLLRHRGVPERDIRVLRYESDPASIIGLVMECLQQPADARPTAIITHDDVSAIAVMRAAGHLGFHVPRDLSIISMTRTFISDHLPVALSTIDAPLDDILAEMVTMLLARMKNPQHGPAQHRQFPTRLILRESTAVCCEIG